MHACVHDDLFFRQQTPTVAVIQAAGARAPARRWWID
jgi:hypothetical protein